MELDKVQNFAKHYDKLFYITKSKFFAKNASSNSTLSSDFEQEIVFLFASIFKYHYEDCAIGDIVLSELIGRHAFKNLTSRWSSIRKGLPIEIPFTIDPIKLRVAEKYFSDIIEFLASKWTRDPDRVRDFEKDDQIPVDPNSPAMIEVCNQLVGSQQRVLETNFGRTLQAVRITGVVKLHPVETTKDNPSTAYHTDGDNSLVKIILYLENNRDPYDGNFSTLPYLFYDHKAIGFSPFARCFLSSHFLREYGFRHEYANLFDKCISHSHAFTEKASRSKIQRREYPIFKWSGILFSGSSLMHRGGHNIKSRRPVLQGYVHPF